MGAADSRPGPSEGQETGANAGVAGGTTACAHDATLEQHCEMWEQAHGEPASRWTMSRAIKHLGWTRKKAAGCYRAQRRGAGCLAKKSKQASSKAVCFS